MIIEISDLLKQFGTSKEVEGSVEIEDSLIDNQNFKFRAPIQVKGKITNLGEVFDFEGNLSVLIDAKCDRCLKDFKFNFNTDIFEKFSKEAVEQEEVYIFKGQSIVLDDIVRDCILLNLPMQKVCDENCKGLCPKCGIDRNFKNCECENEEIDPRLAKLKNLFK